jgi:signal transduction histidine kinase
MASRDAYIEDAGVEIRNATGSILLAATALRSLANRCDPTLPPGMLEHLERFTRQVRRFAVRAKGIFVVSRLMADRPQLDRVEIDWRLIVSTIVDDLKPETDAAGCCIALRADEAARGLWDQEALELVTVNLLTHAMRSGAGRPVDVTLSLEGADAVLAVRYRGNGMSKLDVARMMGPFEAAVRPGREVGLGLWVSFRLVKALGGSLEVMCPLGGGSVFMVRLPRAKHRAR